MIDKKRVAVIAYTEDQYDYYVSQLTAEFDYFYVSNAHTLLDMQGIDFVHVGEWYKRNDLVEIMQQMWSCNMDTEFEKKTNNFINY